VSRRDPQAVVAEELSGPGYELLSFFQWSIDREGKRVTASLFGLGRRLALFRDGLGCTLVIGIPEDELKPLALGLFSASPPSNPDALWPDGERVDFDAKPEGADAAKLEAAVKAIFAEPHPAHPRRTRALIVVHGGPHHC
jgi:hypothetical protein